MHYIVYVHALLTCRIMLIGLKDTCSRLIIIIHSLLPSPLSPLPPSPPADARAVTGAAFGVGTGPVALTLFGCTPDDRCDSDLLDCSYQTFTGAPCPHTQDAGVICMIREGESFLIVCVQVLQLL